MFEQNPFSKRTFAFGFYNLIISCVNEDNNRIEMDGKAMSSIDICAYANLTMQELSKVIKALYEKNIILNIHAKGKDFYYVNPRFVRGADRDMFSYEWLLELFEEESNNVEKGLVYFKKSNRNININIGKTLLGG
jgi:hypothetical protein